MRYDTKGGMVSTNLEHRPPLIGSSLLSRTFWIIVKRSSVPSNLPSHIRATRLPFLRPRPLPLVAWLEARTGYPGTHTRHTRARAYIQDAAAIRKPALYHGGKAAWSDGSNSSSYQWPWQFHHAGRETRLQDTGLGQSSQRLSNLDWVDCHGPRRTPYPRKALGRSRLRPHVCMYLLPPSPPFFFFFFLFEPLFSNVMFS